jgi:leucyl-tRNA synthetase
LYRLNRETEEKWRRIWEDKKIFEADPDERDEKVFVTVPFPYMNGPLHLGHAFTDGRVDVYARFKRMQGVNTLFPYAWHWTGQPLVAAAERLSKGDRAMIREFVEIDGVPKEEISKFYDPVYMAKYYTADGKIALERLGLSIDWRRSFHTTDLEPTFNKFVIWQMNKLKQKGYITRGTHPVVWCPHDNSPTGDHDRLEGEGVTWEDFTLVLFPSVENDITKLPAATLRPETIFGVTNLWVNPNANYVVINFTERNNENWIVAQRAAAKMAEQLKKFVVKRNLLGKELVGTSVRHPLYSKRELIILPGEFVDPDNGTGIVYSVPAHAPADYVALRDIKNNVALQKEFGLSEEKMRAIQPISLISIPGFGEFPAKEIVDRMGIKDQYDPKVSEATADIYKKEFHQGVMKPSTGKFAGKNVSEAKLMIVKELESEGLVEHMYELPEKVVCRCTTECIVKVLEDQWFLKYSDPEWKKLAHECVDSGSIFPDSARRWFHDVIDWFKDWPCARKVGLGTPLPWSPEWIVETLSDSTIYPAFYTISSTIRQNNIPAELLCESLFDFVILGEGRVEDVAFKSKLSKELIDELREQFVYWYPVNLRNSAKELIPNHLTFFVFQHVAFFSRGLWPTGISVNGMLTNNGAKMSKSKGNSVSLRQGLDQYGADVVRATVLGGSEGLDDVDWNDKAAQDMESKIRTLTNFMVSLTKVPRNGNNKRETQEDQWLETRIQEKIASITSNLEEMRTKTAFQEAFFGYWNDIRYYLKRTELPTDALLREAVMIWIKLLAPFIPFTAEEINSNMGSTELVSISRFPVPDPSRVNKLSLLNEIVIQRLIQDAENITKLMKESKPTKLHIFVAPRWNYDAMKEVLNSRKEGLSMRETMNRIFGLLPDISKERIADLVPRLTKTINELGDEFTESYMKLSANVDELGIYSKMSEYLAKELRVSVDVRFADSTDIHDPKGKARFALPFKPSLFFE